MMLVAADRRFRGHARQRQLSARFAAGALAGAGLAAVFAFFALLLHANQYAIGLAIALLGSGLSAFIGLPYSGQGLPARGADGIALLATFRCWGQRSSRSMRWCTCRSFWWPLVAWLLFRSRVGLVLRAVGESPESAHALGWSVRGVRLARAFVRRPCAGLAGAYLATVYTPLWAENMTAGRGWIALALVVFATWRPGRLVLRRLPVRRRHDGATVSAGTRRADRLATDVDDALLSPPSSCWR